NRTKKKIRDKDFDFLVTAYSWPAFSSLNYAFNPSNIKKKLFHSALLIKVSYTIFNN
ncbi:uncharacterized protein EDB93DRAFT_1059878, partial [Suillus bovinus]|uniref:uncharacterized protein n=1 Tax=Suillus bovinus TaxID=48563 RepID=UPI001B874079